MVKHYFSPSGNREFGADQAGGGPCEDLRKGLQEVLLEFHPVLVEPGLGIVGGQSVEKFKGSEVEGRCGHGVMYWMDFVGRRGARRMR